MCSLKSGHNLSLPRVWSLTTEPTHHLKSVELVGDLLDLLLLARLLDLNTRSIPK